MTVSNAGLISDKQCMCPMEKPLAMYCQGKKNKKGKNKTEILLYCFLIKVVVGYITLENWEKHFQLGLVQ